MEPPVPRVPNAPAKSDDWHCFDRTPAGASRASICLGTRAVCLDRRKQARRQRASDCVAQRIAYCIHVADAAVRIRQDLCARTEGECTAMYQRVRKTNTELTVISPCQPMLNTDYYQHDGGFAERRLREPETPATSQAP